MCNTTTPGSPRRADLPECCISKDAVDKTTGRALALHHEKWTSEPGKTDSVPISEELVNQVPQKASGQSSHPIPAASAPLRASASLASRNTPQVQEEGRAACLVILMTMRCQSVDTPKGILIKSAFLPLLGSLLKKLCHVRES